MLLVTETNLLSKDLTSHFTPNTCIVDSGATCNIRGTLEGMFELKHHVTNIMVRNNETMSNISRGNFQGLVVQKVDHLN
jgi:hypothetical protein